MIIALENLKSLIGQISDSALAVTAKHGGPRAMYPDCKAQIIECLVPLVGTLTLADAWFLEKAIAAYKELHHSDDDSWELAFPRYALQEFIATGAAADKADAMARALHLHDILASDLGPDERETRAAAWLAHDIASIIKGKKFRGDTYATWAAHAVNSADAVRESAK